MNLWQFQISPTLRDRRAEPDELEGFEKARRIRKKADTHHPFYALHEASRELRPQSLPRDQDRSWPGKGQESLRLLPFLSAVRSRG